MNLKTYIENLQKFLEENPECAEMQVITSKDDEGNGYNTICYTPSKGVFVGDEYYNEPEEWGYEQTDINAVCVN